MSGPFGVPLEHKVIMDGVWAAFREAPAWAAPLRPGHPGGRAVSFRRPEDPDHGDARTRYYEPAGQSLAALARQAGYSEPQRVGLSIEETGGIVTVRLVTE